MRPGAGLPPLFAFRLHQFVSKGDNVHVSIEQTGTRCITTRYQQVVPNEASKVLVPVSFCRECGQEYLTVRAADTADGVRYEARSARDASGGDQVSGYLYVQDEAGDAVRWPDSTEEVIRGERQPDSWTVTDPIAELWEGSPTGWQISSSADASTAGTGSRPRSR